VPGAVDVGLSEQDPQDELKIELDRGLANALGISVHDAAQALRVAFAGVEVGDWVDPSGETRDVAGCGCTRGSRSMPSNIERLPIAVTGGNRIVPLGARSPTGHDGKGPSQIQHCRGQAHDLGLANAQGSRLGARVTADALQLAKAMDFPARATASSCRCRRATQQRCSARWQSALVSASR
jgi:HAE1 family hydrophobic/amphiphilic exporter-1